MTLTYIRHYLHIYTCNYLHIIYLQLPIYYIPATTYILYTCNYLHIYLQLPTYLPATTYIFTCNYVHIHIPATTHIYACNYLHIIHLQLPTYIPTIPTYMPAIIYILYTCNYYIFTYNTYQNKLIHSGCHRQPKIWFWGKQTSYQYCMYKVQAGNTVYCYLSE